MCVNISRRGNRVTFRRTRRRKFT